MSLQQELDQLRSEWAKTAPQERQTLYDQKLEELKATGIESTALAKGAMAPEFSLPAATGGIVSLAERLQKGPVVITFYRGGWCPYCNLQLRAYQRILPDISRNGASLIAISPEMPDGSLSVIETNQLAFTVLSDVGNHVARTFGLVYALAPELRDVMRQVAKDLRVMNGDESWELPIPATYVIRPDRTIAYAAVDADYRRRAEPQDVIAALSGLADPKLALADKPA